MEKQPIFCQVQQVSIDDSAHEQRIDNYLLKTLSNIPHSHIYKIIRSGQVRVNGKRVKPLTKLMSGDVVRIPPISISNNSSNVVINDKFNLKSRIIYQDDELLVINKPAGLSVHGGSKVLQGLVETARQVMRNPGIDLVHRLDRNTSGCLILTKKRKALVKVHDEFRNKRIIKTYLAIVKGKWDHARTIEKKIMKSVLLSGESKVRTSDFFGKKATMKVEVLEYNKGVSLIKIIPNTGRTHQIRVLTADEGFPIVGDDKYGDRKFNNKFFQKTKQYMLLHALSLEFNYDGVPHKFYAPIDSHIAKYYLNYQKYV